MKKALALILTLALTLPLFACGGGGSSLLEETETAETLIRTSAPLTTDGASGEHDATGFCAGFGRADITPTKPVPLAGYGDTSKRISQNVLDNLYFTIFLLQDESGEKLAIVQMDVIAIWPAIQGQIRSLICKATGVKEEYVLLNATHTHSGPDGYSEEGSVGSWRGLLYKAVTAASKAALADLDRCEKIRVGTVETDRLNFVRRYYLEHGFACDNATYGTGEITGHESPIDQEMRLVRFVRKNQPDLVMANWQCHPHRTGSSTKFDISSDIIGTWRKKAEAEMDVKFLYLQGGAGDVNPTSRIVSEQRFTDYRDIGHALCDHMFDGLNNNMTETAPGAIRAEKSDLIGTVSHNKEELVETCRTISSLWSGSSSADRAEAQSLLAANALTSIYEVRAILSRANYGETDAIPLYCYAFGDVAIASAPFEMFNQTEKGLREVSPFPFTLTCGYSNSGMGYMPAADVWDNEGYEVVTCRFVKGTAEAITGRQLEMLGRLHGN